MIAHRRAKERLTAINDPHTVLPDETVDDKRAITPGGTKPRVMAPRSTRSASSPVAS